MANSSPGLAGVILEGEMKLAAKKKVFLGAGDNMIGVMTLKQAEEIAKKYRSTINGQQAKYTIFDAGTHYRINYYYIV